MPQHVGMHEEREFARAFAVADAGRSASSEITGLNQTKLGNYDSGFSKLALVSP
jgi:hypothetical protein